MLVCHCERDKGILSVAMLYISDFHFIFTFVSIEEKGPEVFASPDRQIQVIKFKKEPGKLLGEENRQQLLLYFSFISCPMSLL